MKIHEKLGGSWNGSTWPTEHYVFADYNDDIHLAFLVDELISSGITHCTISLIIINNAILDYVKCIAYQLLKLEFETVV